MSGIKVKESMEISFDGINSETPKDVATKMRQKILDFFKKNPTGIVNLQFGGYARMSTEFAKELFDNLEIRRKFGKIKVFGMHVFDQVKFDEAME